MGGGGVACFRLFELGDFIYLLFIFFYIFEISQFIYKNSQNIYTMCRLCPKSESKIFDSHSLLHFIKRFIKTKLYLFDIFIVYGFKNTFNRHNKNAT